MDSPLRWVGGKRWQLDVIRDYWQPRFRLVELFAGGLSVALGLEPDTALVNDVNADLVNFWRWVQQGLCVNHPCDVDAAVYAASRERFNDLRKSNPWSRDAAEHFYYLNRTCFNGVCRYNKRGDFNTPFGHGCRSRTVRRDLTAYVPLMRHWHVRHGDFSDVPLGLRDFVYADPPYDDGYTSYTPGRFSWDDQVRLARLLSVHVGPVIITNHPTHRILELYESLDFECVLLEAPRRVSSDGNRANVFEVFAMRNL